jgi:hypothetical protein
MGHKETVKNLAPWLLNHRSDKALPNLDSGLEKGALRGVIAEF